MRASAFAAFFAVVMVVLAGWHIYLWLRLVRAPHWPAPYGRIATLCLLVLFCSIPLALVGGRVLPMRLSGPVATAAFTWFGLAFLLLVILLGLELARLALFAASRFTSAASFSAERRVFFSRIAASTAALATGGLGVMSIREAIRAPRVARVRVELERFPAALSGFVVAQLSDVHIGPELGRRFLEAVVERTNALEPDLIVITGDLVDGSVERLREDVAPLGKLRARHGVFFVTGNHEYYSGADAWIAELRRLGVRVLRNERVTIGHGEASFVLAGVDDATADRFGNGHGADYEAALGGVDPTKEVVLLAHQPRQVLRAEPYPVGLQLSGHTHGGQIWPFHYLVRLVEPYLAGLYRHGDRTQIYVNSGTGFWGPPMRLFAPSEISELVLFRSSP